MKATKALAVFLATIAAAGVAACGDTDSPSAPETGPSLTEVGPSGSDLESFIRSLVEETALSAAQREAITGLIAEQGARLDEPGGAWKLAAQLAGILTGEQIESIERARTAARQQLRAEFHALRGNEERNAANRGNRGDRRQQEVGREGVREQREQRSEDRRAQHQARREQEHAALVEVLGLSDEQSEALRAFGEQRPEGTRTTDWRKSRTQALESILDDEQLEVVALHRMLVGHRLRTAGTARIRHHVRGQVHGRQDS